ncbi:FRG domain-containing protein [Vibrio sp. CyArs1]|uniref:FRG domain-containing protein n=1 Tax=Vibrio sp. CyArs1 TaxID=2682577 RepID=UPI001F068B5D|nr:FRG domain-containing protein [Vibrio sp. CyArs1]
MFIMNDKHYINTIEELYEIVNLFSECNNNDPLIYRAEECSKGGLIPSLGKVNSNNLRRVEQELLSTMKVYGVPMLDSRDINEWLLMCLSNQQGFPTRLLEWTDSLFNVMWSVCNSSTADCVNILKVRDCHKVNFVKSPHDIENTKIFKATDCDFRTTKNDEWYSIHPFEKERNGSLLSLYDDQQYVTDLISIYISPSVKNNLLKELISMSALKKTSITVEEKMANIDSKHNLDNNGKTNKGEISNDLEVIVHDRKLEQYGRKYHQDFDFD